MQGHAKFNYADSQSLRDYIQRYGLSIPFADHIDSLKNSLTIGRHQLANRLATLPMEGCDGELDGKPGELTERRYLRFAQGGTGILWFEATAVVAEGRANPRQLWLNRENVAAFSTLLQQTLAAAKDAQNQPYRPFTVLQLTHSGRYAKPDGTPRPIIADYNPWLDTLPQDKLHIITDDEIEAL